MSLVIRHWIVVIVIILFVERYWSEAPPDCAVLPIPYIYVYIYIHVEIANIIASSKTERQYADR